MELSRLFERQERGEAEGFIGQIDVYNRCRRDLLVAKPSLALANCEFSPAHGTTEDPIKYAAIRSAHRRRDEADFLVRSRTTESVDEIYQHAQVLSRVQAEQR